MSNDPTNPSPAGEGNIICPAGEDTVEAQPRISPSAGVPAELALQIKEQAIAASINAIAISDLAGRLTYINNSFLALWGYEQESQVLGRTVTEFWKDPAEARLIMDSLRQKNRWSGEMVARREDGTSFTVQLSATLITDKGGHPIALMASFLDLTEHKRAEAELTLRSRIAQAFLTVPDEEIFGEVSSIIRKSLDSPQGAFGFLADNGDLVICRTTLEIRQEFGVSNKYLVFPPCTWGNSLWGWVIRNRQSCCTNRDSPMPEGLVPINSLLAVPVVFQDRTIGLLSVGNRPGGYLEEHQWLLENIAGFISPILHARQQRDRYERDRWEAGAALQRLSARHEAILHEIPDIVVEVDVNKIYTWANSAGYKFFGEDVIGREAESYFIGDQNTYAQVKPLFNGDPATFYVESWQRRKDGEKRLLAWWCRALRDLGGEVTGAISTARDITEQKRAEEKLLQANEHLSLAQRAAGAGTWDWDMSTGLLSWSPEFLHLFGLDPEKDSATFDAWRQLLHPDDRQSAEDRINEAIHNHVQLTNEYRIVMPSGVEKWIYALGDTTYDERGEARRMTGICIDITQHKRSEEELRQLEAQIQHTQKLESLGVLAGGIAHDFNNILLTILGNADLALDALSEVSPARPCLEEIEKAARRAADLTRQMLAYSGKGRFEIRTLDLSEIAGEMAHLLQASISKKARLCVELAGGLPAIRADAEQLQQIIMNLIVNASESIDEEDGGLVKLLTGVEACPREYLEQSRLPEKVPPGRYVFLEVTDTGCGMNQETLERLFEPFFTTKFAGRGLGMSAVLGIVRGHQGAILVQSQPGRGTVIRVLFPALEQAAVSLSDRKRGTAADAWKGSGTILLVDDEPAIRALGRQMLERFGFEVVTASDGMEALEIFRTCGGEIACVLLDLSMPRMDGEQAFYELRRIRNDCRVILATGYAEQETEELFTGKGVSAFIQKPYNLKTLREKLQFVLGG